MSYPDRSSRLPPHSSVSCLPVVYQDRPESQVRRRTGRTQRKPAPVHDGLGGRGRTRRDDFGWLPKPRAQVRFLPGALLANRARRFSRLLVRPPVRGDRSRRPRDHCLDAVSDTEFLQDAGDMRLRGRSLTTSRSQISGLERPRTRRSSTSRLRRVSSVSCGGGAGGAAERSEGPARAGPSPFSRAGAYGEGVAARAACAFTRPQPYVVS